ncbi:MAG: peptidoglycan-binding protein [Clostridiales bacterium]|nr:peptidoglycan-binding protein [Clostridiales bacterium]
MGIGYLSVEVRTAEELIPIRGAEVSIRDLNGNVLFILETDESGATETVSLEAPDKSHTLDPNDPGPHYLAIDVEVNSRNYDSTVVRGAQVVDSCTSVLPVNLTPLSEGQKVVFINVASIPANAMELKVQSKKVGPDETIYAKINKEVEIPQFITVHLAAPSAHGQNIQVPFLDYIKNVCSSEIYPTWPDASLRANILCEITFALNRIYTDWYRTQGYPFDITNSLSYDQYYVYGRNTYQETNILVERLFNEYVREIGHKEPFFTDHCSGLSSICEGLEQWHTVQLAEKGLDVLQILKQYYPKDIEVVESNRFIDAENPFPGFALSEGSEGDDVRVMQNYLNRIRENYPLIPQIRNPNGIFSFDTANAVKVFQQIFGMRVDGIIGKATWYKISFVYSGIKKLAELKGEGDSIKVGSNPPTSVLREGARGTYAATLQFLLNYIGIFYPGVQSVKENATFDAQTKASVISFQSLFGLIADGVVGPATWRMLYDVYNGILENVDTPSIQPSEPALAKAYLYPGYLLKVGARGEEVRLLQKMLNSLSINYPQISRIAEDGEFATRTRANVKAFQDALGLASDGIAGPLTWSSIVEKYAGLGMDAGKPEFPGYNLEIGSSGEDVMLIQNYLNGLADRYPGIPKAAADGDFNSGTQDAVKAFQRLFQLTADGIVGPATWNKLVDQYLAANNIQIASGTKPEAAKQSKPSDLSNPAGSREVDFSEISLDSVALPYGDVPWGEHEGEDIEDDEYQEYFKSDSYPLVVEESSGGDSSVENARVDQTDYDADLYAYEIAYQDPETVPDLNAYQEPYEISVELDKSARVYPDYSDKGAHLLQHAGGVDAQHNANAGSMQAAQAAQAVKAAQAAQANQAAQAAKAAQANQAAQAAKATQASRTAGGASLPQYTGNRQSSNAARGCGCGQASRPQQAAVSGPQSRIVHGVRGADGHGIQKPGIAPLQDSISKEQTIRPGQNGHGIRSATMAGGDCASEGKSGELVSQKCGALLAGGLNSKPIKAYLLLKLIFRRKCSC